MASRYDQCLVVVVVLLAGMIGTMQAFQFTVGGGDGWVPNPHKSFNDYSKRLRFQVNDTLFFKYKKGSDSVLLVNKEDYDNCNTKKPIVKMDDGDSTFKFDRSGPFYFISGVKDHCKKGQKLEIVVLAVRNNSKPAPPLAPGVAPAISPSSPPPSATTPSPATQVPVSSPTPAASLSPAPAAISPAVSPSPSSLSPSASSPSPSPAAISPAVSPSPAAISPAVSPSPSSLSPSASTPSPSPGAISPATQGPAPASMSPATAPSGSPAGSPAPGTTSPPAPATGSPSPSPSSGNANSPPPPSSLARGLNPSVFVLSSVAVAVSLSLLGSFITAH